MAEKVDDLQLIWYAIKCYNQTIFSVIFIKVLEQLKRLMIYSMVPNGSSVHELYWEGFEVLEVISLVYVYGYTWI